ncbi:MAG: UDP-N-acetylmuramoyl-tripeptide--D-alanyl-D-alanine ligase [Xanthomonadales bacterium]|nr:UDP-N-acetylmuramoyl-tripeptide--D-alanyl-D-alanine ligase [Xanthomonadales bacterium]
MIQMNLHQIAAIVGGSLVGKEARIQGVTTDSRIACRGKLFVALQGEQFDGHQFCQQAEQQGAAAMLVSKPVEVNVPQVICKDSLKALQALATTWVKQTGVKVIGITGSNGKTTVKNMLYSVLSQQFKCTATQGNYNNEIGVPLTLLAISPQDEVAVIEMGAAQVGDIKLLAKMAQPDVAVVTNVSQAHIGRFGSEAQIAQGKGELYESLDSDGLAVVNIDSPYASQWMTVITGPCVTFGENEQADVRLLKQNHSYAIQLQQQLPFTVQLPVLGHHNYLNACAVVAIASNMGLSQEDILKGLANFQPEAGRLNTLHISEQLKVIDDSYNANPASVKAAIEVLQEQAKPTVLIVGDMAELGDEAISLHGNVGQYAQQQGVDKILAVGQYAQAVCQGNESRCQSFDAVEKLMTHLSKQPISKGTVLVKGSRSMRMERIVEMLVAGGKQ